MNNGEDLTTLDPHQRYEELCALAGAGQVTPTEAIELNEHLRGCSECREAVRDFAFLCVQVLPAALKYQGELPAGMTERFIARARSEGIRISDRMKAAIVAEGKEDPPRNAWKTAFWAAVAACLFIGGILLWVVRPASKTPPASVMIRGAPPTAGPRSSEKSPSGPESAVKSGVEPDIQALEAQLRTTEARLATVTEELEQRQRESTKSRGNTSQEVQAELRALRATVQRQKQIVNDLLRPNKEGPSTAGPLARRNLHVIDVFPTDEHGKRTEEFAARLLYVEGKRLDFFAFDLNHYKGADANSAFYLWGQRRDTATGTSRIILLGRFRLDDPEDNRWIVVVSDPKVLAGLRFVFVTVESTEHPVSPTGKKLLLTPLHAGPD